MEHHFNQTPEGLSKTNEALYEEQEERGASWISWWRCVRPLSL